MFDQSSIMPVYYKSAIAFDDYRVGDDGSVWTCLERCHPTGNGRVGVYFRVGSNWKKLKPLIGKSGYARVCLRMGATGKRRTVPVSHLILAAFVGPCPPGMEAAHGNGIRADNRLVNLRWATKLDNAADKVKHGTVASGEKNGRSKLSAAIVCEAKTIYHSGSMTYAGLARRYGVTRSVMRKAILGHLWSHVDA